MFDFILGFIHLVCAMIFVGYVFLDALLGFFKSKEGRKKLAFIYAAVFLVLILSGVSLAFSKGYWMDNYIFSLKMGFILLMIIITLFSIYYARIKAKNGHFLVKYAHLLAFVLCLIIVFLAKLLVLSIY